MRKNNPQYIVNLVRQVLAKSCVLENRFAKRNIGKADLAVLATMNDNGCSYANSLMLAYIKNNRELSLDDIAFHFKKVADNIVQKMTSETLGKVISYGLDRGEKDETTFRRTSYTDIMEMIPCTGRKFLETLATAVILAAIRDYLCVLKIAVLGDMSFKEAGSHWYLSD